MKGSGILFFPAPDISRPLNGKTGAKPAKPSSSLNARGRKTVFFGGCAAGPQYAAQ